MRPSAHQTNATATFRNRRKDTPIVRSGASELRDAITLQTVARMNDPVPRPDPSAKQHIDTDALVGPWSVLTSKPFTGVAVHERAGHLLIDFQSTGGNVRMQLTRRDLPLLLKTLIDALGHLAAVAE